MLDHVVSDVFHDTFPYDPFTLSLTTTCEQVDSIDDDVYNYFKIINICPKLFDHLSLSI